MFTTTVKLIISYSHYFPDSQHSKPFTKATNPTNSHPSSKQTWLDSVKSVGRTPSVAPGFVSSPGTLPAPIFIVNKKHYAHLRLRALLPQIVASSLLAIPRHKPIVVKSIKGLVVIRLRYPSSELCPAVLTIGSIRHILVLLHPSMKVDQGDLV